jgi:hypothetical protein
MVPRGTPGRLAKVRAYNARLAAAGVKERGYDMVIMYEDSFADTRERDTGTVKHHAIDIVCAEGAPVVAPCRCIVDSVNTYPRGGFTVTLKAKSTRNNRWWQIYNAHLMYPSPLIVGSLLMPGDFVGQAGISGTDIPHLHQAVLQGVRKPYKSASPVDQVSALVEHASLLANQVWRVKTVDLVPSTELEILSILSMWGEGLIDSPQAGLIEAEEEALAARDVVAYRRAQILASEWGSYLSAMAAARTARSTAFPPQWRPFPYKWARTIWPKEGIHGTEIILANG